MFDSVGSNPDLVAGEREILEHWEATAAFDKLRARNAGGPRWSFIDGPITANNPMGVHHAWGRTYKDAFQRHHAMNGFDERYQNGFDCQGLWVEVEVEKELGFRSKRDIEAYGLEKFINRCKERVLKFSAIQTAQSIRLGYWMEWDHSYYTMSPENNYTIWSFLKRCHERGLLYKGLDAMPWCPRCGTGISEQERKEGYREVEDDSLFARFPLRGRPGEYLLVWTTTPWTLAANVAAAVNPELPYAKVRQGDAFLWLARSRLDAVASEGPFEVLEERPGSDLVGWAYDGPFDELDAVAAAREAHRVIPWTEVSEATGTGIVHIAPGCGKEDFDLGKEFGLPIVSPIDESGVYLPGFGQLSGVAAADVATMVTDALRAKGLFHKAERYRHDYPHCWRCATPLLFRAVDEWYIDMSWRDEIMAVARRIRWIPEYGLDLELDWLSNMGDWMISKKRYWGLALPIFECRACGTFDVIGSREELEQRSVAGWDEFVGDPAEPNTPHRPWIDAVRIACPGCGAEVPRIPDVGNPWLDAGIVPYSTVRYNTDREYWARWVPADFVVESFPGQFRNWFYALLAMSTMMEGIPPFRTLLGHALVRDEHGQEMHKSAGNAIWFDDAVERMGADVMRWLYCRQPPTTNLNFGYAAGQHVERKVFSTLWNTYAFFVNYARLDGFDPAAPAVDPAGRPEIDRWILSDLQLLIDGARKGFSDYLLHNFVRQAEEFVDQLSNWYVRRNRRRFWRGRSEDDRDKLAAYQTLYEVLTTLNSLLAPIVPFVTERMHRNLAQPGDPESVHHTAYPEADPALVDRELSAQMRLVQHVVTMGHALRDLAALRVRQPLSEVRVATKDPEAVRALERLASHVTDELNVKALTLVDDLGDLTSLSAKPNFRTLGPRLGRDAGRLAAVLEQAPQPLLRALDAGERVVVELDGRDVELAPEDVLLEPGTLPGWVTSEAGGYGVALHTELTDGLRREGWARDVVRHIQQIRKDLGLEVQDRIAVRYRTEDPEVARAVEEWSAYVAGETLADALEAAGEPGGDGWREVRLGPAALRLEVRPI
ncbi:MAG: isoleucine--tRNA ligase [Actinomycetota bacterium]